MLFLRVGLSKFKVPVPKSKRLMLYVNIFTQMSAILPALGHLQSHAPTQDAHKYTCTRMHAPALAPAVAAHC